VKSITIEAAVKRFGTVQALAGIDLHVKAGEFVVLLGPSGSGKTTLLRVLAGLERLDGGRLVVDDVVVDDPGQAVFVPAEKRKLGMVFQEYALWPHLDVLSNVGLALRQNRVSRWRERALAVLESVGLSEQVDRYPHQLSGGQQQRVALARALAGRPDILLFDEPLSNLDAKLREELRLEIAGLVEQHGTTAVYITHDQEEAFFLAARLGVMHRGRLLQYDRPENVYLRPATPFVADFTGASGRLRGEVRGDVLQVGATELRLDRPAASQGAVEVNVRPDAVALRGAAVDGGPAATGLEATVVHCAFSVGRYHYWLRLSTGERLEAYAPERFEEGLRVSIELVPDKLMLFASEGSDHHALDRGVDDVPGRVG